MPKRGEYATTCKRGHDLTQPDSRLAVPAGGRGLGGCRLCLVENTRKRRGSTKTGPPSRYKGDEDARLAALALGMKRCPECEQAKELTEFNNDKHTADGKGSYCRACTALKKNADYQSRREELLIRAQARKFGVTVSWLVETLARQGGTCAICKATCISGRALAVDHDHDTGQVRELLCANCNRALGLLRDSPTVAAAAAVYLAKWKPDDEQGMPGSGMPGPD